MAEDTAAPAALVFQLLAAIGLSVHRRRIAGVLADAGLDVRWHATSDDDRFLMARGRRAPAATDIGSRSERVRNAKQLVVGF